MSGAITKNNIASTTSATLLDDKMPPAQTYIWSGVHLNSAFLPKNRCINNSPGSWYLYCC